MFRPLTEREVEEMRERRRQLRRVLALPVGPPEDRRPIALELYELEVKIQGARHV